MDKRRRNRVGWPLRSAATAALLLAALAGASACGAQRTGGGGVGEEPRYLALGDSYTIGEGVPEGERWPVQLAGMLRAEGIPLGDPRIIATTGWTTEELDAAIDRAAPRGPYALVTLLIGVNDQYRGMPVEGYAGRFRALLRRAVGFAGGESGRVVVLSIPDWGVTPFAAGRDRAAVAREIDAFNQQARDITADEGAHWVDVTGASRAAPESVVGDGLHPDGVQYAAWARLALPSARRALGR